MGVGLGPRSAQFVETPRTVEALELMVATVGAVELAAEEHLAHSVRNEDGAVVRCVLHPRRCIHGDARDVGILVHLDLTGVKTGTNAKARCS
jgi:hypothetical protein